MDERNDQNDRSRGSNDGRKERPVKSELAARTDGRKERQKRSGTIGARGSNDWCAYEPGMLRKSGKLKIRQIRKALS